MPNIEENTPFMFYASPEGDALIRVYVEDEDTWVTQAAMSEIFGIDKSGSRVILKTFSMMVSWAKIQLLQKMQQLGRTAKLISLTTTILMPLFQLVIELTPTKQPSFVFGLQAS